MKKISFFKSFFVLFICLSFFPALPREAFAGEPTVQVKQTVDAVMDILKNKDLKRPEKAAERKAKIRKVVDERFDFEEMSQRALALHWKKRTPEERKEFVALFSDLLESTYIKKVEKYESEKGIGSEKVIYGEEKVDGPYAVVKTIIVTSKEVQIPMDYRLLKEGAKWEVYDVVIEGVSLVNNYRNQFNNIIRTSSYQELLKRLKNKTLKEPS